MEFDVQQWHRRGAIGLGIVASVCYLASITTSEISPRVTSYFLASLAGILGVWIVGRSLISRPMLYVWPVLNCLGMMGASLIAPDAAVLTLAALVVGFLYVGFTQPRGGSLVLVPVAMVSYIVIIHLPPAQVLVRLFLGLIIWLAVAELPAWLIGNLAAAREALLKLATTDALTGLSNRREWDARLQGLADGSDGFAVLLIDLDHFKAYNDQHGHLAGDELLTEFASRLRAVAGAEQILARWGGEEFVIALPGADQPEAETVAARALAIVPDDQTCSIGIAVHRSGESPRSVLDRADKALYLAKSGGRARLGVV